MPGLWAPGSMREHVLLAMIVMEAAFGIAGLIAAPICYAYVKNELSDARLIYGCHFANEEHLLARDGLGFDFSRPAPVVVFN